MTSIAKKTFVPADENLNEHQEFLVELLTQGVDAWNAWNKEHGAMIKNLIDDYDDNNVEHRSIRYKQRMDLSGIDFGSEFDIPKAKYEFCTFVDFSKSKFIKTVFLTHSKFHGKAIFRDTVFFQNGDFGHSKFYEEANFIRAVFKKEAHFLGVNFNRNANFMDAVFQEKASFFHAGFYGDAEFLNAVFKSDTTFINAHVENKSKFNRATFVGIPSISISSDEDKYKYEFNKLNIKLNSGVLQKEINTFTTLNIERLRAVTEANHAINETRDLFILQRQAERSFLWNDWKRSPFNLLNLWRAVRKTILMFCFWLMSNYGRSATWPALWLVVSNIGFYKLYKYLHLNKSDEQIKPLMEYTLSNSIPFGKLLNPAFDSAVKNLFIRSNTTDIDIPFLFQFVSMFQGIISAILLFLIGLGIRNFFRIG